jgi:hypothetical protein
MIRTGSRAVALVLTLAFAFASPVAATPIPSTAPAAAAGVVRSYFEAFRRQDARALGKFTSGQASRRTNEVLERIWREAAEKEVGVELRLQQLALTPRAPVDGMEPVEARFTIDVVAKKWFFSTVARHLAGRATFYVEPDSARADAPAKIVGISLKLD